MSAQQLPTTGTRVAIYIGRTHLEGVVGDYEHYRQLQQTFPVMFGTGWRIVSLGSCCVLEAAIYAGGPRCLLASCGLHPIAVARDLPRPGSTDKAGGTHRQWRAS